MKIPSSASHCITRMFIVLAVVTGLVIAGVAPKAFGQTKSGFTYDGIVYTSWWFDEYGNYEDPPVATGAATTSTNQLVQTSANYASVLVTQYVQTGTSTTIAPDSTKTPLDDQVAFAIQGFHNQGMKVFLKPHVDSLDGTWRGQFEPTSTAAWFASFQTFIVHYATLAQANNVEGLVIGTEYKTLSVAANETYWANIIAAVRAVYSGQIAYAANASGPADEFSTVSFWPLVDIIGVDGYVGLTTQSDPTVAQLVSAWTDSPENGGYNAVAAFENLSTTYNKPVIFTELGYESTPGTNIEPWNSSLSDGYDPTEQADCYEAFFEVFSQQTSWMKGVFWWNWSVPALSTGDTSYDPNGKPAGTVELPEWFGSATPIFKISPSASVLSLAQNDSATDTITVQDEGGFTGSVNLAVSGLTSGVTASLGTNPTTGSSVLTLKASATATAGTSTVTITGTSGTLTATTKVSLTITASACTVTYTIGSQWQSGFGASLVIANTGTAAIPASPATSWTLTWPFANGQAISEFWGGTETQSGAIVTAIGTTTIPAGGSYSSMGFNGTWNNVTNAVPTSFALNGTNCTVNGTAPTPGFTLAPSVSPLSVTQGSSATDTITVTDTGGFTGSVAFTATGLPSGVTASFSPASSTSASVLELTASSTATTGPAAVSITGTSGSTTATTTIALTVNPSVTPSFTLTPSPTSLSVAQGKSSTDTIAVADVGGFTGSVSFVATGMPSGVTASFSPASSSSSSVLTLTASSTATVGAATVTITGTSGSTTAKTTIALSVTNSTPSFTLAPSAGTLSVTQGKTATNTITVTDVNGFAGSVTLATTGLPSGVTVAYGTNPTTGTSVLTFTASATATAGTSTVTVTGTSGSTTATTTIALTVAPSGGGACTVDYVISPQNTSAFGAAITIVNGPTAVTSWTLTWSFANGQTISSLWNGIETQSAANVTVKNEPYNGSIAAGGTLSGIGFNGTWNGTTNAIPTAILLNGTACTVN
jgi:hypothetical protein